MVYERTFHDAASRICALSSAISHEEQGYALLHAVVKDLMLLRAHGKDSIERESVGLGPRLGRVARHLDGREVVAEGDAYVAALALLDRVRRSESAGWRALGAGRAAEARKRTGIRP